MILYYLRKEAKYDVGGSYKYTTVDCVFSSKISAIWEKYLDLDSDVGCADEEHVIGEYIEGTKCMLLHLGIRLIIFFFLSTLRRNFIGCWL